MNYNYSFQKVRSLAGRLIMTIPAEDLILVWMYGYLWTNHNYLSIKLLPFKNEELDLQDPLSLKSRLIKNAIELKRKENSLTKEDDDVVCDRRLLLFYSTITACFQSKAITIIILYIGSCEAYSTKL